MKKQLSLILSLGIIGAVAQSPRLEQQHSAPNRIAVDMENYVPVKKGGASILNTGIGKASNAFSTLGPRTYLWVDPNLNTITFTHRNDASSFPGTTSGHLRYDVSKDGGQTWSVDQGPIWNPTGATGQPNGPARYPQCVLFNPSGNTEPDSAYLAFFAPTLNGQNSTGSWGGLLVGSIQLDGTDLYHDEVATQPAAGLFWQVADDFTFVADSQKVFGINGSDDVTTGTVIYRDTLILSTGTFNPATKAIEFVHSKIPFPFAGDPAGTPGTSVFADVKIAFSPDGSVGYISGLGYLDDPAIAPYGVYSPAIMKTTDGGKTWTTRKGINIDNLEITHHGNTTFKDSLSALYPTWSIGALTTAFEHDLVVDQNNNPHIILNLGPSANNTVTGTGTVGTTPFSIYSALNMIVDIYSSDGGNTWRGHLIDTASTFRGRYGADPTTPDFSEDNRPQIARNADGSMLIYAYGSTDALIWSTTENHFPDVIMRSLDVATDQLSLVKNMTRNTPDVGTAVQFNLPHIIYDMDASNEIFVPVTATGLINNDPTRTSESVQYNFYDFMFKVEYPIGIDELALHNGEIKALYPNPAADQVSVHLTIKEPGKYSLEISSVAGITLKRSELGNIGYGNFSETLDISNLPAGVYLISLRSGNSTNTQRLVIN